MNRYVGAASAQGESEKDLAVVEAWRTLRW
jgi:hypothetical protein